MGEEMSLSEDDLNGISDNADEKDDEDKDQYLESRDSAEMEILDKLNKVEIDDYSTLKNEKHLNDFENYDSLEKLAEDIEFELSDEDNVKESDGEYQDDNNEFDVPDGFFD